MTVYNDSQIVLKIQQKVEITFRFEASWKVLAGPRGQSGLGVHDTVLILLH